MNSPVKINPSCAQCHLSRHHNGGYICEAAFELQENNGLEYWFTTPYQRSMAGHCKPWGVYFEDSETGKQRDQAAAKAFFGDDGPFGVNCEAME